MKTLQYRQHAIFSQPLPGKKMGQKQKDKGSVSLRWVHREKERTKLSDCYNKKKLEYMWTINTKQWKMEMYANQRKTVFTQTCTQHGAIDQNTAARKDRQSQNQCRTYLTCSLTPRSGCVPCSLQQCSPRSLHVASETTCRWSAHHSCNLKSRNIKTNSNFQFHFY